MEEVAIKTWLEFSHLISSTGLPFNMYYYHPQKNHSQIVAAAIPTRLKPAGFGSPSDSIKQDRRCKIQYRDREIK